jgi:glycosyltransferase involved in cell wall biosynthesis
MTVGTHADRPLATVVIPTYNDVDHLLAALELIQAQTWPHIEIIVADDASAEPVEPRVRGWPGCDERISIVRRTANGGVVAALQTGLARARGEYVYLASTNDTVEPGFLEASIAALERHRRAGMCFSDSGIIVGWNGKRQDFPLHLARGETWFEPDDIAARLRRRPFHVSSNTAVFRSHSLKAIGGCRPELGLYADWFACIVTALSSGAVYVPRVLAYSRLHADAYSASARWTDAARARYAAAAIEAIAAELPEILPRLRRSAALSDFGLRVLAQLARDPRYRSMIGVDAFWTAALRAGWRHMLPRGSRRFLRRVAMWPEVA